jgi:hypothetical protein
VARYLTPETTGTVIVKSATAFVGGVDISAVPVAQSAGASWSMAGSPVESKLR